MHPVCLEWFHFYLWSTYRFGTSFKGPFSKYNTDDLYGPVDHKIVLDADDDVAHVIFGGKWRLPSESEVAELVVTKNNLNYQWEWKTINGHNGWLLTYLVNKNSIFIPAAGGWKESSLLNTGTYGSYWSSSLGCLPYFGLRLQIDSEGVFMNKSYRFYGFSIRPVTE